MRSEEISLCIACGRVEELAPFPFNLVRDVADEYPNAEVIWCQEEPLNQVRDSTPLRTLLDTAVEGFHRAFDFDAALSIFCAIGPLVSRGAQDRDEPQQLGASQGQVGRRSGSILRRAEALW